MSVSRTAPLQASAQNDGLGCSHSHCIIWRCLGAPVLSSAGWAVPVESPCDSFYELQVFGVKHMYICHIHHTNSHTRDTWTHADTYAIHTIHITQTHCTYEHIYDAHWTDVTHRTPHMPHKHTAHVSTYVTHSTYHHLDAQTHRLTPAWILRHGTLNSTRGTRFLCHLPGALSQ